MPLDTSSKEREAIFLGMKGGQFARKSANKNCSEDKTVLNTTSNLQQFLLITRVTILMMVHIPMMIHAFIALYFGITVLNNML